MKRFKLDETIHMCYVLIVALLCLQFFLYCNLFPIPRTKTRSEFTKTDPFISLAKTVFGNIQFLDDYKSVANSKNSSRWRKCKLCPKILNDHTGDSSEDDLVIAVLLGGECYNVLTFVKTLRSTGCKCSIVFISEPSFLAFLDDKELKAMHKCGVVWMFIDDKYVKIKKELKSIQNLLVWSFLDSYGYMFNRVLICDALKTVFQKDPFQKDMPKDKVIASFEKIEYQDSIEHLIGLKFVDQHYKYKFWKFKYVVNNEIVIGPAHKAKKYLETLLDPEMFFYKAATSDALFSLSYYRMRSKDLWIDFGSRFFASTRGTLFDKKLNAADHVHDVNSVIAPAAIYYYSNDCNVKKYIKDTCSPFLTEQRYPLGNPDDYPKCGF